MPIPSKADANLFFALVSDCFYEALAIVVKTQQGRMPSKSMVIKHGYSKCEKKAVTKMRQTWNIDMQSRDAKRVRTKEKS